MRSPHRAGLVAAALAATLLVAACGSSAGTESSAKPPARIRITGVGSYGAGARATAAGAPEASDPKSAGGVMPSIGVGPTEFVVEGTLATLDGDAQAWHYAAVNGVKAADVAKLAKQLGVAGDVRDVPAEDGGGWRVGSTDFTAPWLSVERSGMGSWYYDAAAYSSIKVACAPVTNGEAEQAPVPASDPAKDAASPTTAPPGATPPDGGGSGSSPAADCPAPTPPANVPSADEAKAKAMTLAKQLGVSPQDADVRVDGDEWGRYVTWSVRLGGVPSGATWSAAYGGEGVLLSASGALATPEQAATYPRIGTSAALELLRTGRAWGSPVAMDTVGGGSATVSGGASGSATASPGIPDAPVAAPSPAMTSGAEGRSGPDAPACPDTGSATGACTPPDFVPAQPVTVTISGVEATLYLLWGADGDVWLVPGYRFTGPTGEVAVVPAIDESYVEQVAPADGTAVAKGRGAVDVPPAATETAPAKP